MGRSRFHSTGPLAPIARTAEFDLSDPADNRDTYYLRDAHGGHVGLLTDHDANLSTPAQFSFTTYDAFGNAMSASRPPPGAGSFSWRGAEGSVYDAHSALVYMQARHYDPTIGRFIQPDSLALASLTTQGMNRYIYCENDPVNCSDPNGRFAVIPLIFVVALLLLMYGIAMLGRALAPTLAKIGVSCILEYFFGYGTLGLTGIGIMTLSLLTAPINPFAGFFFILGLTLLITDLIISAIMGNLLARRESDDDEQLLLGPFRRYEDIENTYC